MLSGIAAHGYGHSHAEGGVAHTHGASGAHHEGHCHGECHHDHHDGDSIVSAFDAAALFHGHFSLLGFEFSTPASDGSDSNNELGAGLFALLSSGKSAASLLAGHLTPEGSIYLLRDAPALSCAVEAEAESLSENPQLEAPPLCDRARFERTGVLRI